MAENSGRSHRIIHKELKHSRCIANAVKKSILCNMQECATGPQLHVANVACQRVLLVSVDLSSQRRSGHFFSFFGYYSKIEVVSFSMYCS
jgi:hypothetical protein